MKTKIVSAVFRKMNKSIRLQILMIVLIAFLILVSAFSYTSSLLIFGNARIIEKKNIKRDVERLLSELDLQIDIIRTTAGDWAPWDDTYEFIQGNGDDYIQNNLNNETLANLNVEMMLFVDNDNQLFFGKMIDLDTVSEVAIPESVIKNILKCESLFIHRHETDGHAGILSDPRGLMIISSEPILTSQKMGPIRGTLIVGRWLNQKLLDQIKQRIQLDINFYQTKEDSLSEKLLSIKNELKTEKSIHIHPKNNQIISGYTLLNDVIGDPALLMEVNSLREAIDQARKSMRYLIFTVLIIVIIITAIIWFMLEKRILLRLTSVVSDIRNISREGSASSRVNETGSDEIFVLANSVNNMLDYLEDLKQREWENEQNYRELFNGMKETVWIINMNGKLIDINDTASKELGYSKEELLSLGLTGIDENWEKDYIANQKKFFASGEIEIYNTTFITKDGKDIPVEIYSSLVKYHSDKAILCVARDITLRKRAEDKIKSLLDEKEMLLKETHHRIKNNMSIIKSLLSMQAKQQKNPESAKILLDAASRVQSMAVLYNSLYRSKTYNELNVKDFLPPLINEISSQFQIEKSVQIVIEIEDIILPAKILSTLAILINECITNSMKHAFHKTNNPQITVSLSKAGELMVLRYSDNGCGIPDAVSLQTSDTFGMSLIMMLVSNINGRLSTENDHGLHLIIEFEI